MFIRKPIGIGTAPPAAAEAPAPPEICDRAYVTCLPRDICEKDLGKIIFFGIIFVINIFCAILNDSSLLFSTIDTDYHPSFI